MGIMPNLQEIDLSWCTLLPQMFTELGENLLETNFLQSVNFSYLNVSDVANEQSKAKHIDTFIDCLVVFIRESCILQHLNFDGMGFTEAQVTKLIKEGVCQSRSLVGVHLSGNEINEGSCLKATLCHYLGISTRSSQIVTEPQPHYPNMKQLMLTGYFPKDIINHSIYLSFKNEEKLHLASASSQSAWTGMGFHKGSRSTYRNPITNVNDAFVIYRFLGHVELMFSKSNLDYDSADGKWQLQKGNNDTERLKKGFSRGCYFCEKHKFVQVFFNKLDKDVQYDKVKDPKLIRFLNKEYGNAIKKANECNPLYRRPVILGTLGEDRRPVEMVNAKLFSAFLTQSLVFESNQNENNLGMLKKNLRQDLLNVITSDEVPEKYVALHDHLQQQFFNWRTTFHQYLKYSNQFDCYYVGYPILKSFMPQGFRDKLYDIESRGERSEFFSVEDVDNQTQTSEALTTSNASSGPSESSSESDSSSSEEPRPGSFKDAPQAHGESTFSKR